MFNKIKKAVFPVAGLGTRFLPATKAMPKELLPIIDKPLIQYAVEEAIEAGIETLIFVTGRNKRAIEDHFDRNFELESLLVASNKAEQAEKIKNILPDNVECIFVRQSQQLGLGHAVLCAERAVAGDPFCLLLADDFIIDRNGNATSKLIKGFNKSNKMQLLVMKVLGANISKYGVMKYDSSEKLIGLIEKPSLAKAPSIGRYVLTNGIFNAIRKCSPGSGNEIQLADALNLEAGLGNVEAVNLGGKRFDCGSVEGYIEAIKFLSKDLQF